MTVAATFALLVCPPLGASPAMADCTGGVPIDQAVTAFAQADGIEAYGIEDVRGMILVEAVAVAPQSWIAERRARATAVRHWGDTEGIALTRIVDPGTVHPLTFFEPVDDCVGSAERVGSRHLSLVVNPGDESAAFPVSRDGEGLDEAIARLNSLDVPQRDDPIGLTDRAPAWIAVWWPYAAVGLLLLAIPVQLLRWFRRRRRQPPTPS